MKKVARLYKQFSKILLVSGVVLVGAILLYWLAEEMSQTSSAELNKMRRQLNFKKTEVNTISNQLDNSKDGERQFLEYLVSRQNNNFSIDVQEVKRRLRELQKRFDLSENLKLTLSNPIVLTDPELRSLPHTISTITDAKLTFVALSDLHVYSFIQAIQSELPGVVELTRISLEKRGELNTSALARISARDKPELVDVELQFNWYSFTSKSDEAEKS